MTHVLLGKVILIDLVTIPLFDSLYWLSVLPFTDKVVCTIGEIHILIL